MPDKKPVPKPKRKLFKRQPEEDFNQAAFPTVREMIKRGLIPFILEIKRHCFPVGHQITFQNAQDVVLIPKT